MLRSLVAFVIIFLYCSVASAQQQQEQIKDDSHNIADYEKALNKLADTEIKTWLNNDIVIKSILEQNSQNANLTDSDCRNLNRKWKGEQRKSKKALIKKVLSNELSDYLRYIQARSENLYTQIIVTDSKGLNVGESIMSSNYWHGDEDVWENTFGNNSYATYITGLAFNNDTQLFQTELSFMIVHNEEPIGIVIVGVDVEQLDDL